MTTINSPWIKWDGGECPVPPDTRIEIKCRTGKVLGPRLAYRFRWKHIDSGGDIVEYRTSTEQPDLEAAEKLLRENGYTIIPPAKPPTFEDVVPMTDPPPKGTGYWLVHPFSPDGVSLYHWQGISTDNSALRHRMAYLDREHAIVAAKHIFGLKGGAL